MKIAIAGYGVEGEASYKYWRKKHANVTIVDESATPGRPIPTGAKVLLGENVFDKLQDYDLVVRTAGLPPNHIVTDGQIWSSTNEFFVKCPAPIIGVTGTKGKGTTASLIASILRSAGRTVHLVGNIGTPALSVLDDVEPSDIVVFELSSFQLWDLERSPHVAVVLMIEPDHLDIHADFDDYVRAKCNVRRFQTAQDVCFYYPNNKWSKKIAESSVLGDVVKFASRSDGGVYVEDGFFKVEGQPICSVDSLKLPGAHNLDNACAAISASRVFTVDEVAIARGLESFDGLDHRLKFVKQVDGVSYYDDSIATTPGSAMAALKAFDQPKIIILGGFSKGAGYKEIVNMCKKYDARVVAIGSTGSEIAKLCRQMQVAVDQPAGDMRAIVKHCHKVAKPGDVVLLSPASASFDMFKNYIDRGEQFIRAVRGL